MLPGADDVLPGGQAAAAPPPAASALRKAIAALKQRRPAPVVQHLQGSKEDFAGFLIEVGATLQSCLPRSCQLLSKWHLDCRRGKMGSQLQTS